MQSGQLELDNLSEPLDVFYDEKKASAGVLELGDS